MKQGIDFPGVCVVYFCHDGHGRFVMSLRSSRCRDEQGRWDIGGGAVDHGVPILETVRREIFEEYCTNVVDSEFLGYRDIHRNIDGLATHWIGLDFKVLVDPSLVRNGEPHKFDDVQWFTSQTIPSPTHSQLPIFLELYRSRIF